MAAAFDPEQLDGVLDPATGPDSFADAAVVLGIPVVQKVGLLAGAGVKQAKMLHGLGDRDIPPCREQPAVIGHASVVRTSDGQEGDRNGRCAGVAVHLGVYGDLTVRHNMQLPLQHSLSGEAMDAEIARLLERLNLAGTEDRRVAELAHGQRQWLAIGMALAMRPVLLLLDEPTAGMGPEETRATGALVHSVHEEGVTIVVVEHDMAFVRQLGAPVTVLHYGRVFAEGSLAAIEGNEDVRNIYLGGSRTMAVRGRHH